MHKSISYIILLVFLLGCEEYFVPNVDTQVASYVFEGVFTDVEGSHVIKITKSQTVDQDSLNNLGVGFKVFIECVDGTIYDTREKYPGYYYTRAFQKGAVGKKYRMTAISPEGKKYSSTWELMEKVAPIDSVYGDFEEQEILKYNKTAGYFEEVTRGINVYCDVSTKDFCKYYRYEYNVIYLSVQSYPTIPFYTYYYVSRPGSTYYTDFVSVANGYVYNSGNITQHKVGLISETNTDIMVQIPEIEIDNDGNSIFEKDQIGFFHSGLLVELKQYSLSEKGFDFWNAVHKQLQGEGRMFDPVQSQVVGNVFCVSDTTETVYGFFGASSMSSRYVGMKLKNNDEVSIRNINSFPDLPRTFYTKIEPDYWVVF